MKKKKREARNWEDLPTDFLVDVFGRVGIESLLVNVPYVCKTWFKATRDPFCWKQLDFPDISRYSWFFDLFPNYFGYLHEHNYKEVCATKFLKVIVDRSGGCATMVKLPACYTHEAIAYVSNKCPALKKLVVHAKDSPSMLALSKSICRFKNLESLQLKCGFLFETIVEEIGAHCESFVAFSLVAEYKAFIGEGQLDPIVSCLPKLKCLVLRELFISREDLIRVLKECVELVHLDVGDCRGFDEDDEEILKLASHIPSFETSGSVFDVLIGYSSEFYHSFFGYDYDLV